MGHKLTYRDILRSALESSQLKNPAFSVGSLGRLLGIPSSRMGQILNGKVGISVKRATDIADALKLSEINKKIFLLLVQCEHDRNPKNRQDALEKLERIFKVKNLDSGILSSINNWQSFVVFEYLSLVESTTLEDLTKRLHLSVLQVETILKELIVLDLVKVSGENIFEFIHPKEMVSNIFTSDQARKYFEEAFKNIFLNKHAENLNYLVSLSLVKYDSIAWEKIEEKIKKVAQELKLELEAPPTKNAIGCFAIQFLEVANNLRTEELK